jgi:hypothetical protein
MLAERWAGGDKLLLSSSDSKAKSDSSDEEGEIQRVEPALAADEVVALAKDETDGVV